MLQVVFHAQIETELGVFDIDDVANDICVKLIHRHPHVFGDVVAENSAKSRLKKMCGREYMGIVRTTFLLDEEARVSHIIEKVDTKNHASQILG